MHSIIHKIIQLIKFDPLLLKSALQVPIYLISPTHQPFPISHKTLKNTLKILQYSQIMLLFHLNLTAAGLVRFQFVNAEINKTPIKQPNN